MLQLREKILEALRSALPITIIVYVISLLSWFSFTRAELIVFTIGAVLLMVTVGVGLFGGGIFTGRVPATAGNIADVILYADVYGRATAVGKR